MSFENDDDLIEQYPVQEVLVDSFVRHQRRKHLMTAVGFRWIDGSKVIVTRLAWPAENTSDSIADANHAMANPVDVPDRRPLSTKSKVH